jgi:hypothetical protein
MGLSFVHLHSEATKLVASTHTRLLTQRLTGRVTTGSLNCESIDHEDLLWYTDMSFSQGCKQGSLNSIRDNRCN